MKTYSPADFRTVEVREMALVEGDVDFLTSKLTLTSTGKRKFTLALYKGTGSENTLWIPRALVGKQRMQPFLPVSGTWEGLGITTGIDLRPEQEEIVGSYLHNLVGPSPYGGIIKAPTGSGKTIMGIELIQRIGLKTLIVVPTDRIMSQWVERMKTFSSATDSDIGIVRQGRAEWEKPIVIGMIHTLVRRDISKEVRNAFGHTVFDEIHILGAETFSRVAGIFNSKYRTGLSATPRRKDGMEAVFLHHIGNVAVSYEKFDVKPKVFRIEYYDQESHHKGCVWNGELNTGRYFNKLALNRNRNNLIARLALQARDKGHKVLILSDRLNQIDVLRRVHLQKLGVPSSSIGVITANEKCDGQIILGTYGSAGLGMDIPDLSALIFATPRVDIEQAVGRILRRRDGKLDPVVIDLVDVSSHIMEKWWKARYYKYYRRLGLEITEKRVTVDA